MPSKSITASGTAGEFDWNDGNTETVRRMFLDEGASALVIQKALGCRTRNMVVSKLRRMGLTRSGQPPKVSKPSTKVNAPKAPRTKIAIVVPVEQRKTFEQLTIKSCRWPFGDPLTPDFYFCGARRHELLPYCKAHARMAYQPARERRRQRKGAMA